MDYGTAELKEGTYSVAFDYHSDIDDSWWYFGKKGKPVGRVGFVE